MRLICTSGMRIKRFYPRKNREILRLDYLAIQNALVNNKYEFNHKLKVGD